MKKNEKNEENEKMKEKEENIFLMGFGKYNAFKLEPLYSGADNTCLWELVALANHYHPTVRMFSQIILRDERGGALEYEGNPLLDYSLQNVLDRILMKRPKLKKSTGFSKLVSKNKVRMSKIEAPLTIDAMLS